MELSGLLIPVLGGYWLLSRTKSTRYWTYRQSGYHLFFHAAMRGALLLIASWAIARILSVKFPGLPWEASTYIPIDYATVLLVTLGLAWTVPLIANWICYRKKSHDYFAKKAAREDGNLVDWTIQDALNARVLIEVTTKSGKSYIGMPQSISPPTRRENDLVLFPLLSGYRKPDTRELKITTDYRSVLKKWRLEKLGLSEERKELSHLTSRDFLVALPYWEVASARRFDLKLYESFFGSRPRSTPAKGIKPIRPTE